MTATTAATTGSPFRQRLDALAGSPAPVLLAEVHALYDSLPPVPADGLVGAWSGGIVPTGHPGEAGMARMRWAGKVFRGPDDVDPIVVLDEAGARRASDVMGAARVRAVEHRGVVTATMLYDVHPVLDHFRLVDDETLLGLMDRKGDEAELAFLLRRLR